jgi:hypothetical protein
MNSNMGGTRGPTHQPVVSAAVMWLTVSLLATTAQAKYGGGTGTAEDPYLIYTAEQMNTIGLNKEDWDKHFKLMADLDLSAYKGSSFNRIGLYDPPSFPPIPPTSSMPVCHWPTGNREGTRTSDSSDMSKGRRPRSRTWV